MKLSAAMLHVFLVGGLLAGCGANDVSTTTNQPEATAKKIVGHRKTLAADYSPEVQELYISYYGRPADPAGLTYWDGVLLGQNAPTNIQDLNSAYSTTPSIQAVVNSFGNSAESQALYGTGNATTFVTAIYANALGRTPDPGGLAYWVGLINANKVTQAQAALSIVSGAVAEPSTSTDEQLVSNRLAVASNFTAALTSPAALSSYSGTAAAAAVRAMLATVTSSTDVADFQTNIYSTLASLVAANSTTFPIDAAITAFYQSPQSFSAYYTDSSGNVYNLTYVATPSGSATFAGQTVQSANVTITMTENGTSILSSPATVYFQTGPFKLIGELFNSGTYDVVANQEALPTFAQIGSTGGFATAIDYSNSSMSSVNENVTMSWSLNSSTTAGAAYLCVNANAATPGGGSETTATCYQTNTNGQISGFQYSVTANGETIVFNSSASSVPPISISTPGSLGCGAAGGSGYNGISFIPTSTGSNGYFTDSNSYASATSTDSFTYGVAFDNPNLPSLEYTGSLRVQLWALPTSYTGTSLTGYLMSTLPPDFVGQGSYSADQLYNFNSAPQLVSSAFGTNPPAGTYCIAAVLQEYTNSCGTTDGYCTIDWRNVINPQTFY